ncbi:glycosyltransferase [Lactobacillus selangorensis]|uniref:Glycosyltransferase n=1 Tax=Lactobacillus selangorensis TaxID=81857 RepID=A0A0R2FTQ5_9LACO|nr:glycosyltransferase [Lactobacillus selangorensis]KRN28839.1 glycosyltransferase [Lactobacillus selangorensis]KRN32751.1 glycosyltransferase [Lactobacillus selangorensis]
MYYFVSENIFTFNSGTEHSQARRTKLFNKMGRKAVYVSRNYNRYLERDRQSVDLPADQSLNMYDYFQGTVNVPRQEQNLRLLPELPLDEYHIHAHGPNYSTLDQAGKKLAKITVQPATVGLVNEIVTNDQYGNQTTRENWDWRGFLSSVDYFHPDGSLGVRRYLDLKGNTVIEQVWMNVNGKLQPTLWKLLDYHDQMFRFNTEDQLYLFFLNELIHDDDDAKIISDRRTLDYVVADVQGAKQKWPAFHGLHTERTHNVASAPLLPVYQDVLTKFPDAFDGVLVATPQQQQDLQSRYPQVNVLVAPDTVIDDIHPHQPQTAQVVLYVGRLSAEKRPEEALKVFAEVKRQLPDAKMIMAGYASGPDYLEQLKHQANNLGIDGSVDFAGYQTQQQLHELYAHASVILQTSEAESFGMNLVEAMGYGVPVVTYDIQYGTPYLVLDDQNGYVVPDGLDQAMATKVIKLLTDDTDWQSKSQAAQAKAVGYTPDKTFAKWKQLGF